MMTSRSRDGFWIRVLAALVIALGLLSTGHSWWAALYAFVAGIYLCNDYDRLPPK
jgi:uncharacterized protein (DUF2235 family)